MPPLRRPCLCLVTDRRRLSPEARTTAGEIAALEAWLDGAAEADIDLIQIRERDLDARTLTALARSVTRRLAGRGPVVLVNDRADVAFAAGVGGVHVRSDGPPVARLRGIEASWIVGRSIHTRAEALEHGDADYLLFGTVFAGGTKPAGHPLQGLDGLRAAAAAAACPVLAIGGITPDAATACLGAGAWGVAAIGLFLPPGRSPGGLGLAAAAAAIRAAWAGVDAG